MWCSVCLWPSELSATSWSSPPCCSSCSPASGCSSLRLAVQGCRWSLSVETLSAVKWRNSWFFFAPQGKFYRCTDEAKSSPEECKSVSPLCLPELPLSGTNQASVLFSRQRVVFPQGDLHPVQGGGCEPANHPQASVAQQRLQLRQRPHGHDGSVHRVHFWRLASVSFLFF